MYSVCDHGANFVLWVSFWLTDCSLRHADPSVYYSFICTSYALLRLLSFFFHIPLTAFSSRHLLFHVCSLSFPSSPSSADYFLSSSQPSSATLGLCRSNLLQNASVLSANHRTTLWAPSSVNPKNNEVKCSVKDLSWSSKAVEHSSWDANVYFSRRPKREEKKKKRLALGGLWGVLAFQTWWNWRGCLFLINLNQSLCNIAFICSLELIK